MARRSRNFNETKDELIKKTEDDVILGSINEDKPEMVNDQETKKTEVAVEKKFTVNCDGYLNVRSGPSKDDEIKDLLANGTEVTVMETNGNWAKIGPNRWVMKEFLQ